MRQPGLLDARCAEGRYRPIRLVRAWRVTKRGGGKKLAPAPATILAANRGLVERPTRQARCPRPTRRKANSMATSAAPTSSSGAGSGTCLSGRLP